MKLKLTYTESVGIIYAATTTGRWVAANEQHVWVSVRLTPSDIAHLLEIGLDDPDRIIHRHDEDYIRGVYDDEAWSDSERREYLEAWSVADDIRGACRRFGFWKVQKKLCSMDVEAEGG